ncbi:MAG: DUF2341 domain-containing protein [Patescibacteria group bacterium]
MSLKVIWESKAKITATQLATQKIEMAHNLDYEDVGTVGGIPNGPIEQLEQITRNNIEFAVRTQVIYIDDVFDGTQDGDPDDTLNTDYKRIKVEISWPYRFAHKPIIFMTDIMPLGLESAVGGGTLKILVYNASGQPVSQADVTIQNTAIEPNIDITTVTDDQGYVILPGSPESVESYEITVSKTGYSSEQTYGVTAELPSPEKPHASVFENQTTNISFAIDEFGTMIVGTVYNVYDDWWSTAWNYRKKITFDNTASSENLDNVPVLIKLYSDNIDYAKTKDSGEDIRFVDSDNVTELPYEIEDWDESGYSYVWVKVPRINKYSNVDYIYMYYNNNSAIDNQDKLSVWDNGYGVVWHMEGQGSAMADSSGNRSDASLLPTWTWNSGGAVSDTLYMQAHDPYNGVLPKSTGIGDGSDWTINFWVAGVSSAPWSNQSDQFVITSGRWTGLTIGSQGNPPESYIEYTDYNNDAKRNSDKTKFGNGGFDLYTLSMDWDGGGSSEARFRIYKNGNLEDTFDENQDPSPNTIYLGTEADLCQSGTFVDEFRISTNVRSSNWIRFQYCSMTQSCITIGGEEDKEDKKSGSYIISNIDFNMRGNKIIGYDSDELPVYKNAESSHSTGYDGLIEIPNLEWDSYSFSLPISSVYNISETTPTQPLNLLPASTTVITLGLSAKANHSALITVKDINEVPIDSVNVHLYTTNPSYDEILVTNASGQVYFTPWIESETFLNITASGYENYSDTFELSGYHIEEIIMTIP